MISDAENATMLTETNATIAHNTETNDVIMSTAAEYDVTMSKMEESDVITSTTTKEDADTSSTEENDVILSIAKENDVTMSTTEGTSINISSKKGNNAIKSTTQFTMTEPDNLLQFLSPLGLDDCVDQLKRFRFDNNFFEDTQCFCSSYREYCREEKYRTMDPEIFLQLRYQRFPFLLTEAKRRIDGRTTAVRVVGILIDAVGILGETFCISTVQRHFLFIREQMFMPQTG